MGSGGGLTGSGLAGSGGSIKLRCAIRLCDSLVCHSRQCRIVLRIYL